MESLELKIIAQQSQQIGNLSTANIELSIRLAQALQTIEALEKELIKDGNTSTESPTAETERCANRDTEWLQQS